MCEHQWRPVVAQVSPEHAPGPVTCASGQQAVFGSLRVSLVVTEQEPFCPFLDHHTKPGSW